MDPGRSGPSSGQANAARAAIRRTRVRRHGPTSPAARAQSLAHVKTAMRPRRSSASRSGSQLVMSLKPPLLMPADALPKPALKAQPQPKTEPLFTEHQVEKLKKSFLKVDKNSTGSITRTALAKVLRKVVGGNLSKAQLEKLLS